MQRKISARKLALLLLLRASDSKRKAGQPIVGITRLQKLMFLIWKRLPRISPGREIVVDFSYTAQKFGPADSELYADLDFLVALGHIRRASEIPDALVARVENIDPAQLTLDDLLSTVGNTEAGADAPDRPGYITATDDALSFDYLMGDEEPAADLAAGERTDDWFAITQSGLRLLDELSMRLEPANARIFDAIAAAAAEVRANYGDWALQRLLRYVYTQYPEMTGESEIRTRVLGGDL